MARDDLSLSFLQEGNGADMVTLSFPWQEMGYQDELLPWLITLNWR
jgi:hypothetical protein